MGILGSQKFAVLRLLLGTYRVTIPANSFQQLKKGAKAGCYLYSGVIDGVLLSIQIVNLDRSTYQFKAQGLPVGLTGLTNAATVSLTIGDDAGTTWVYADF